MQKLANFHKSALAVQNSPGTLPATEPRPRTHRRMYRLRSADLQPQGLIKLQFGDRLCIRTHNMHPLIMTGSAARFAGWSTSSSGIALSTPSGAACYCLFIASGRERIHPVHARQQLRPQIRRALSSPRGAGNYLHRLWPGCLAPRGQLRPAYSVTSARFVTPAMHWCERDYLGWHGSAAPLCTLPFSSSLACSSHSPVLDSPAITSARWSLAMRSR